MRREQPVHEHHEQAVCHEQPVHEHHDQAVRHEQPAHEHREKRPTVSSLLMNALSNLFSRAFFNCIFSRSILFHKLATHGTPDRANISRLVIPASRAHNPELSHRVKPSRGANFVYIYPWILGTISNKNKNKSLYNKIK